MTGCVSIMTKKAIGELVSFVIAVGQLMVMLMKSFLCGMRILHPSLQKNLSSSMAASVVEMSGSWTSLHMTNGYAVIAGS